MDGVTDLLDLRTGDTDWSEIPEDQVVLGTVGLESVTVTVEDLGHGSSVGSDLLGVSLPSWVSGLLESNSDTSNGLENL